MTRVAMGDVWDETRGFVSREGALLLPLAMATLGASYLLLGYAAPAKLDARTMMGPWMLMLVPCLLLTLFGNLAISALVLAPGRSVGEACRAAAARLPRAVLASLLAGAGLMLASVVLTLGAVLLGAIGAGAAGQQIATAVLLAAGLWLTVRLLPLFPLIAAGDARATPLSALRQSLALTRGRAAPLAAVMLLYLIGFLLVSLALGLAFGSVLMLIGRLLGDPLLATTLVSVLSAVVAAALQGGWAVFVAILMRRLMAARAR